jgi:hypothetical protein
VDIILHSDRRRRRKVICCSGEQIVLPVMDKKTSVGREVCRERARRVFKAVKLCLVVDK